MCRVLNSTEMTNYIMAAWCVRCRKERELFFFCLITEREYINVSTLSVGVDEEAREGAVFVGVSAMYFAPVELYAHLVPHVQVEDDAVGGVVVVLICILSNCTGPHLRKRRTMLIGMETK